jgi:hypothetical protein
MHPAPTFDGLGRLKNACIYGRNLIYFRTAGEPKKLASRLRLLLCLSGVGKASKRSDILQSRVRVSG